MNLRTLRVFVEVVRQGGFSSAAKTVFATQSTVSKAVKQLEEEIGAPLLERLREGIRLTDLGEAVYPRAVRLLADRADMLAAEEVRQADLSAAKSARMCYIRVRRGTYLWISSLCSFASCPRWISSSKTTPQTSLPKSAQTRG